MEDNSGQNHSALQANEHLRRVLESAPLILWAIDSTGKITLSEGKGLVGLGVAPGQLVGMSVFDLYAESPEIIKVVKRGLTGEEFSHQVPAGGRVFETHYSPLRDDAGAVAGFLAVSVDVTERCRADEAREELQVKLLKVQKLESLGLLAGGIAHDFNNILTAIMGSASSALLTLGRESAARSELENVVDAAHRAALLTKQMLAYAGKGHFEVKAVDLSSLVQEMVPLLESTLSRKVQLRLDLQAELPTVEADIAQLQQILMNLVVNGGEAHQDRPGTIFVSTGVQDVDAERARTLLGTEELRAGRYVVLEVRDTGNGMDEETLHRVFDPFFSTKFTGRGLGLAAVLGIARAHAGALQVSSTPGQGSTFKVYLPASDAPVQPSKPRSSDFRGAGLVLVVDDDTGVRTTVRYMLEYFGFSVIEAVDGREGVDTFRERADEIRLVFLDMTMPRLNGEEAFREIRQIRPGVRVILTSGYNEIEATRRFTSKGLAGFLQKPFGAGDLADKLHAVVGSSDPPR